MALIKQGHREAVFMLKIESNRQTVIICRGGGNIWLSYSNELTDVA